MQTPPPSSAIMALCLTLRALSITTTGVRGPLPSQITFLSRLEELDMSSNKLDGPCPDIDGYLPNLRYVAVEMHGVSSPLLCMKSLEGSGDCEGGWLNRGLGSVVLSSSVGLQVPCGNSLPSPFPHTHTPTLACGEVVPAHSSTHHPWIHTHLLVSCFRFLQHHQPPLQLL